MSEFLYPLDVTGAALSNRVRGEFQTLSPPTQSDNFHFIIPKAGPYYRNTLKIRHVSTNRELKMGIDWEPGHYFHSASYETEGVKGGIYQSILFLDRTLSGQIHLEEYFVLGGHWSLDENKILEILSNRLWDPRTITYEQVSGKPEVFPPIEHMHPAGDLVGMREQVEATHGVASAIREQTNELPGKLELILQNYYDKNDVDDLLQGLSEELINGIAGPELEAMLRNIVAGMIDNYYTKSQIDSFIGAINDTVASMYTNHQIDLMMSALAEKTYVDTELGKKVDTETFENALESVTSGSVYQKDLDDLENKLTAILDNHSGRIDSLNIKIESVVSSLSAYVRLDDLDRLISESTSIANVRVLLDEMQGEVDVLEDAINVLSDSIVLELSKRPTFADIGDIVKNLLPEETKLDPNMYPFLTESTVDFGDDTIDLNEGEKLQFEIFQVIYAETAAQLISFRIKFNGENRIRAFTPEFEMVNIDIPDGEEFLITPTDWSHTGLENRFLISMQVLSESPLIIDVGLGDPESQSSSSKGIIGIVHSAHKVATLTRVVNTDNANEEHEVNIELTPTQVSSGTLVVDFPAIHGNPTRSTLMLSKLTDTTGRTYPVHSSNVVYEELSEHKLTVNFPPMDTSLSPSIKLKFEAMVNLTSR